MQKTVNKKLRRQVTQLFIPKKGVQKKAVFIQDMQAGVEKSISIKGIVAFFAIMGLSFICTVAVIRLTPLIVKQLRKIPKMTAFVKNNKRKVVFSGNENYISIEPVLLKEYMDTKKQSVLVIDTRSRAEYENGHIKNAQNVPLYLDFRRPYETLQDRENWMEQTRKLSWGMNEVILYGYRPDADLLLVAVDELRKGGLKAKILSVGYGDWQGGFWNWIPGGELNGSININDYIERTNK